MVKERDNTGVRQVKEWKMRNRRNDRLKLKRQGEVRAFGGEG